MISPHTRSGHYNPRKPNKRKKRLIIGIALLLSVLVPLIIFTQWPKDNTPEPKSSFTKQEVKPVTLLPINGEVLNTLAPPVDSWKDYTIKSGDTIGGVLSKFEMSDGVRREFISSLSTKLSLKRIRPGHELGLLYDYKEEPVAMRYRISPVEIYEIHKTPDGFKAKSVEIPIETKKKNIQIKLTSSLSQALHEAGESSALIQQIVDILAWDIDFLADPRKGDEVSILIEKKFVDGKFYKYGRVLAIDYAGAIVEQNAFYFEPTDGYYDKDGRSLARNFLKSPVMYTRISSKFGNRRHPVTHRLHKHLGTDFAAPTGTPVWALADGRVTKHAYTKFNGNYIAIKHKNGYSTYYLHLSAFAKGLKVGKRVDQKELIGYVGTTGRSTGPHLHLSVKYGGRFIDPLKLKRVKRTSLDGDELITFKETISHRTTQLKGSDKST